jgi:hypothetical protein
VAAYAKANPEVAAAAKRIGLTPSMAYLSYDDTVKATEVQVGALRELEGLRSQAATASNPRIFLLSADSKLKAARDALGLSKEEVEAIVTGSDDLTERFRALQMGRTLVEVARAHDVSGGGAKGPKVRSVLAKSAPSRRLVVNGPDSRISKAVSRQIQAGLPWVPRKPRPMSGR